MTECPCGFETPCYDEQGCITCKNNIKGVKMLDMAKKISDYCNNTDCDNCAFNVIGGCLLGSSPYRWTECIKKRRV